MKYSIVIPVYKSGEWISELVHRIGTVMASYGDFELLLVNDCSPDKVTWPAICRCALDYEWVKGINLLLNAGQFRATMCGLKYASGEYIITMDDDFQQPPEEIPKLIHAIEEDDDVLCVIGKFDSKKHSWYRLLGTKLYQYVEYFCYNKPFELTTTSFRIMRSCFRDALLVCKTNRPLLSPLIVSLTSRIKNVSVLHKEREYGHSGYTMGKLVATIYESIINSSTVPLRVFSITGAVFSVFSIFLMAFYLIKWLLGSITLPGFTTLILLLSFLGGNGLLGIGIIGEYLARIISQLTYPEPYLVKDKLNF